MANKRMFSLDIVDSDAFIEMPASTQALYFHLAMRADDDGFLANTKRIMRMVGAADDDMRVLIGKRFIIEVEKGICVIKHWKIHNYIRKDTYRETRYLDAKSKLGVKENGAYTEVQNIPSRTRDESVDEPSTQVRLDKVRLDKVRKEKPHASIKYLSAIPAEDMVQFTTRFNATEKQITSKAEDLRLYCERKGRTYKNYKSFLLNALKGDFSEKDAKDEGKYQNL